MIKLGKLTDYAIVVMVQLAREGSDASRSAHQLSNRTGLPEPTVAKVLKTLLKEKLVLSARGAQGGYKLAIKPEELSIRTIVEAIDGPISIVACVDAGDHSCQAQARCPTKGRWDPVNSAIRDALESIRLSDMAQGQCARSYDFIQPVLPAAQVGNG
ncbi:MAG: SUF system Fe-S cluster assembly regulator [Micavibrio sp.]|nr:SUF system Fe-S cluster assembly regulator [Micavibrio sp.]